MKSDLMTGVAQHARDRYVLLLAGFREILGGVVAESPLGSAKARSSLTDRLYAQANTWLEAERDVIEEEIYTQAYDAVLTLNESVGTDAKLMPKSADDLDEDVTDHLAELVADLDQALRLQIERDIALVTRCLRDMALTGALRKRMNGAWGTRKGHGAGDTQGALSALVFEFIDRSGRRWPSPRHVAILWRHALVLAWNETALLRASAIGLPVLQVDHPDASFGNLGVAVAVYEEFQPEGYDALPWPEVRREVFHPNSVAWLRPIDAMLSQR